MLLENTVFNPLPKLVVLVGPSGVGKTRISLDLAREFNGEIVNGDVTALYRYLDIGSAKPTINERLEVPHHLIDIATPDENLTVAQYQQLAYTVIEDIISRGKCPFLVGGSGLYIHSVVEGYKIPPVLPNYQLRQELTIEAEKKGHVWLYELLRSLDPVAANNIDPTNIRRVIRAIEVCQTTGQPISVFWKQREVRYTPIIIGLNRPVEELFERINLRVDSMFKEGLVDEVKSILSMGYKPDSPALLSIGYKEVVDYLQGNITLNLATDEIKRATRRLARRQMSGWFSLDDPRIKWLDVSNPDTIYRIQEYLVSQGFNRRDSKL
jgi:tRNA dimethylallyltransferase